MYCFFSNRQNAGTKVEDVFIGFHEDTCPAIILHVTGTKPEAKDPEVLLYLKYKACESFCLPYLDHFASWCKKVILVSCLFKLICLNVCISRRSNMLVLTMCCCSKDFGPNIFPMVIFCQVLEEGKLVLLWCATPDSVERKNRLDSRQQDRFRKYYYERQQHSSLISYLRFKIVEKECPQLFAQVCCTYFIQSCFII